MKLLAKSDVAKHKATEKQREIEEGVKLAQRVDTLREVVAHEEASLEKFRRETVASIHKEIVGLTAERDTLKAEVKTLQTLREEAIRPLDEQRENLHKTASAQEAIQQQLDDRYISLKTKERYVDDTLRDLSTRNERLKQQEARAQELLVEADDKRKVAEDKESQANSLLTQAKQTIEKATVDIEERERFIQSREQAVSAKEEELRTKEIDLAKDFIRLKDREATLERNLKRRG